MTCNLKHWVDKGALTPLAYDAYKWNICHPDWVEYFMDCVAPILADEILKSTDKWIPLEDWEVAIKEFVAQKCCQPSCKDWMCGDDGCGGLCGGGKCDLDDYTTCQSGICKSYHCDENNLSQPKGCCDGDLLYGCKFGTLKAKDCSETGQMCGWNGLFGAFACTSNPATPPAEYSKKCFWNCDPPCQFGYHCDTGKCFPDCELFCSEVECGSPGQAPDCDCGACPDGSSCLAGECVSDCEIACEEIACGEAGENGECDCGGCQEGSTCYKGDCVVPICIKNCVGQECGEDGCGGSCGECSGPWTVCFLGTCIDVKSWLEANSLGLTDSLVWWVCPSPGQEPSAAGWQPYNNWPESLRTKLLSALVVALSGESNPPLTSEAAQKIPFNWACDGVEVVFGTEPPLQVVWSWADATTRFFSLASTSLKYQLTHESVGFPPWSMNDLNDVETAILLNGRHLFSTTYYYQLSRDKLPVQEAEEEALTYLAQQMGLGIAGKIHTTTNDWGYNDYPSSNCVPAPGSFAERFLFEYGLVGQTRLETIGGLIRWCRRLDHVNPPKDALRLEDCFGYWSYCGPGPVQRMVIGWEIGEDYEMNPAVCECQTIHATSGCRNTVSFMRHVLRAVNIPVELIETGIIDPSSPDGALDGFHATAYFPTESLVLPHGDDPYEESDYSRTWLEGADFLGEELLWDYSEFVKYFPEGPDGVYSEDVNETGPYNGYSYLFNRMKWIGLIHLSPRILVNFIDAWLDAKDPAWPESYANWPVVEVPDLDFYLQIPWGSDYVADVKSTPMFGPDSDRYLLDALKEKCVELLSGNYEFNMDNWDSLQGVLESLGSWLTSFVDAKGAKTCDEPIGPYCDINEGICDC
jgi:hypothetical protein